MSFDDSWLRLLHNTLEFGGLVSPRGMKTKEVPQQTIVVDMRRPVLLNRQRKLSYVFMLAEAYWILTGDNKVSTISPFNKRIASFSDDGEVFFGAYGPRIASQLNYVVDKLYEDPDTRQAGLTIWKECPLPTKDVPCTVSIFFSIRSGLLNASVYMRSSDIWLGIPYDVFNFSMLSHLIVGMLNEKGRVNGIPYDIITPGTLHLTAASSHIYETNWDSAWACLNQPMPDNGQPPTPAFYSINPDDLLSALKILRDQPPKTADYWWRTNENR